MISIIVPFFNAERYLDRCINSILLQTYKNFELILVNDGSTDTSLEICNKYVSLDSRVRILSKINEGPGIARNYGMKFAKGDYIGFVDADDYISPIMYETMYKSAIDNDADIVQCGYLKVDEESVVLSSSDYANLILDTNERCFTEYCKAINIDNYTPCKIFRKEIILDIPFGNLRYSEDAYFLIQAFLKCKKLVVLSSQLYYYVQTQGSACRRPYNSNFVDTIIAGEFMYDLTNKHYPHLSYYFARYTAIWCRFNYRGVMAQGGEQSESLLREYKSKFNRYYSLSKIYFPYDMKTFLMFLFRISPQLYELFSRKNLKIFR